MFSFLIYATLAALSQRTSKNFLKRFRTFA
nr:MAG TPA: hypothetical protein [Caudoviricetes sp.]DAK23630.1 MAG TPA: hypothetical protein [Caudoviricetes sp.]DAO96129.1 MAG TPA: hypothetical protein [Caudoviricetes sp.]